MALSEIEKLERRYAENPQGLTFAPLAEVHRKNGEVQRALDLLGPGLALHPDYIPASIVLGRCHLDLGDVHAAERAFLHVLALDGENVIAIKALADISERLLKFDDAERWLQTLLAVDRSNDEAREQLQRVETSRRQAGVASSAEPDSLPTPAVEGMTDGGPEPAGEAALEPAIPFEPPVAEPAVGWVSQSSEISEHSSPPVEDLEPSALADLYGEPTGIQFQEPEPYDDEVEPLDGLVGREVDVPDEMPGEFNVETSEDIVLRSSGGSEFQVPDASLELFAGNSRGERAPFEENAPLPPPTVPEPSPQAEFERWSEPVEEPVAELAVDPAAASPEPELESLAAPAPEAQPVAEPTRAYAAGQTGGRPVGHFLKDILSSRPPAQSAPPAVRQAPAASGGGAPTRPAADALSLSSVFGEEEAPGTPPAGPAPGAGTGVSFDDFFGAPGATPTQRGTRAPDPKKDDLDQFHAWLQNLKR
jgi:hypothetical protein